MLSNGTGIEAQIVRRIDLGYLDLWYTSSVGGGGDSCPCPAPYCPGLDDRRIYGKSDEYG